jgi:hypothetical protein
MPVLMAINPFVPPASGFILSWLAIAGLAFAAWRLPAQVFRPRIGTGPHTRTSPHTRTGARPLYYGALAAANMTLVFLAVFMLPEAAPSWLPPWPITLAFVALLDVGALWLILRWSGNGAYWDDRHKLALVSGMLAFFIAFDVLKDIDEGFGGLSLVALLTLWALRKLYIHVQSHYL